MAFDRKSLLEGCLLPNSDVVGEFAELTVNSSFPCWNVSCLHLELTCKLVTTPSAVP